MKPKTGIAEFLVAAAVCITAGYAAAQTQVIPQPFDQTRPAQQVMPQEQTQGKVTYVSGGISIDEHDAMKQAAAQYPLAIEMASPGAWQGHDPYQANARVEIRDQQGSTVLNTRADGPFLLAKLPPGKYTVRAEINGSTKQRAVDLTSGKHQHLLLEFPE